MKLVMKWSVVGTVFVFFSVMYAGSDALSDHLPIVMDIALKIKARL